MDVLRPTCTKLPISEVPFHGFMTNGHSVAVCADCAGHSLLCTEGNPTDIELHSP